MSLVEAGYVESEVMITILSPLEVFRRFMWNYFRLENEHLNNCGKFRAVRDISVAPMDCSDQVKCPIVIIVIMCEYGIRLFRQFTIKNIYPFYPVLDNRFAYDGRGGWRRESACPQQN